MKLRTLLLSPSQSMPRAVKEILGHDTETIHLSGDQAPDLSRLGRIDLVVGSPAIWVEDEDASEDGFFEHAVIRFKPQLFLLETVRGLTSPRYLHFVEDMVDDFSDHGYTVGYDTITINSRKRLVILGIRDDIPGAPEFGVAHQQRHERDGAVTLANLITANLRKDVAA